MRHTNLALNNFRWKFMEVIMNANKVIPENLVVCLLWDICLYKRRPRPITALQTLDCDWSRSSCTQVNFSKITDNNQILRNGFECIHHQVCIISTQIIECIIFASFDFLQWIVFNTIYICSMIRSRAQQISENEAKSYNIKIIQECDNSKYVIK